ncbi:MAG TPA: LacI family DNA-binding transcriptional regulator [Acidobacteriaceae bacterium]|jgi:LacI family transcriptional regulator
MAGTVRMSDVGKLAGVSTMTVSRVLNQHPNVRENVRKRVFAAIDQLRYQPNELARSLRTQRSQQIGVLVPYLSDPFFALCANAIGDVAKQHGYSVMLATSNEDPQVEYDEACRMLRQGMEGFIIIPSHHGPEPSRLLAHTFEHFPIVSLDRPIEGSRFHSVLVENEQGAQIGTKHLLGLGHKRIVWLGLSEDLFTMRLRKNGYAAAMTAEKLPVQTVTLSRSLEACRETMRTLFEGKRPPTAIFCANNLITRHVLHSLRDMDIACPESVALVGFDDFETADLLRPAITVVRQPVELLGRTAAEMLFARLTGSNNAPSGRTSVLPVELVVRESCGAHLRKNTPRKPSAVDDPYRESSPFTNTLAKVILKERSE